MDDFVCPQEAFGPAHYHMKKQISLGKIRTGNFTSHAKSCNPQEDKLPVLLQSAGAVPPQRCTYW